MKQIIKIREMIKISFKTVLTDDDLNFKSSKVTDLVCSIVNGTLSGTNLEIEIELNDRLDGETLENLNSIIEVCENSLKYPYRNIEYNISIKRKLKKEHRAFKDDFICECGGKLIKDCDIVLCSNPPKYKYSCDTCNKIEYKAY